MNFEQMSIEEIKNELIRLRKQADELSRDRFIHKSERELFKHIPQCIKEELFSWSLDKVTGKINYRTDEPNMNDKFKKFYKPILTVLKPTSHSYKSNNGKYQMRYIGFNEWSENEYKIVSNLIESIVKLTYDAKNELANLYKEI